MLPGCRGSADAESGSQPLVLLLWSHGRKTHALPSPPFRFAHVMIIKAGPILSYTNLKKVDKHKQTRANIAEGILGDVGGGAGSGGCSCRGDLVQTVGRWRRICSVKKIPVSSSVKSLDLSTTPSAKTRKFRTKHANTLARFSSPSKHDTCAHRRT